jgi:predicted naringenin-chalcone synthase
MSIYNRQAPLLSVDAIRKCLHHPYDHKKITHLITVSCTGMSAPGLDLMITEMMDFDKTIFRTSVNFMGCYAAIHALKIADSICNSEKDANVLIVCTELCTLHFQRESTIDNITSSLLFGDGCAAALVTSSDSNLPGLQLKQFYSEIIPKGKRDMAWELSSSGFLMTLSGYIPDLIEEDFERIAHQSFNKGKIKKDEISHWCIHPGGKRVLEAISKSLELPQQSLTESYHILKEYGNLSSATILFILKEMMNGNKKVRNIFGAAFGPGLTVETFIAGN